MGVEAMVQDSASVKITHGLSVLDIEKHALKTILRNLGPIDRMAVVTFANTATTVFELTPMSEQGKRVNELRFETPFDTTLGEKKRGSTGVLSNFFGGGFSRLSASSWISNISSRDRKRGSRLSIGSTESSVCDSTVSRSSAEDVAVSSARFSPFAPMSKKKSDNNDWKLCDWQKSKNSPS